MNRRLNCRCRAVSFSLTIVGNGVVAAHRVVAFYSQASAAYEECVDSSDIVYDVHSEEIHEGIALL